MVAAGMPSIEPARIGKAAEALTGSGLPMIMPITGVSTSKSQVSRTVAGDPISVPALKSGGGTGECNGHPTPLASA